MSIQELTDETLLEPLCNQGEPERPLCNQGQPECSLNNQGDPNRSVEDQMGHDESDTDNSDSEEKEVKSKPTEKLEILLNFINSLSFDHRKIFFEKMGEKNPFEGENDFSHVTQKNYKRMLKAKVSFKKYVKEKEQEKNGLDSDGESNSDDQLTEINCEQKNCSHEESNSNDRLTENNYKESNLNDSLLEKYMHEVEPQLEQSIMKDLKLEQSDKSVVNDLLEQNIIGESKIDDENVTLIVNCESSNNNEADSDGVNTESFSNNDLMNDILTEIDPNKRELIEDTSSDTPDNGISGDSKKKKRKNKKKKKIIIRL
jgi:hypothetical protein